MSDLEGWSRRINENNTNDNDKARLVRSQVKKKLSKKSQAGTSRPGMS